MKKIKRFVIRICKRFNRDEILSIVEELLNVLEGKNPDVKPKDDFRDKHPNYRDFSVDPLAPIDAARIVKPIAQLNYRSLLENYEARYGKPLEPIHLRNPKNRVPEHTQCPYCSAPHDYLYFNDGKKRSQLKCKLCNNLFQLHKRFRNKVVYFCPYCFKALYKWKERKEVTIYKCGNPKCPCRTAKLNRLNEAEKKIRTKRLSQFKLNYQYRDYHYQPGELIVAEPHKPKVDLNRTHNNLNIIALVLTLHISYATTTRKTAHMLKNIWNIPLSYQTVLNYIQSVAYYCHQFNLKHKGNPDKINAGDETYLKGKWHYAWLFIGAISKKICAYNLSDNRGAKPAITTMIEVLRTAKKGKTLP